MANTHEVNLDSLVELLACPCPRHGALKLDNDRFVSVCCGSVFTIQDGIPVLLIAGESNNG